MPILYISRKLHVKKKESIIKHWHKSWSGMNKDIWERRKLINQEESSIDSKLQSADQDEGQGESRIMTLRKRVTKRLQMSLKI